jgi:hypothetical protein
MGFFKSLIKLSKDNVCVIAICYGCVRVGRYMTMCRPVEEYHPEQYLVQSGVHTLLFSKLTVIYMYRYCSLYMGPTA